MALEKALKEGYESIFAGEAQIGKHNRKELRDLIKYISIERVRYDTDFFDEILSTE